MEKKLDGDYTRMLRAILNKSWRQHPTKQQLYSHLPPIMKTIQVRWTRYAGYCWRTKDELISDIFLWTPSHEWTKAAWPAQTYIQQLCADTECSFEYLLEAMDDIDGWWERVRDIHADGARWWWWWWELLVLEYLEPFNCVQTVVILLCKQISFDSFENNLQIICITI